MTEEKRPLKVFLSYASQDRPLVQELSRRLVGEGWIDTWLDVKKLLPGQDWRVSIEEAVEDSDVVIICLSNHSVTKEGYVQKELRYAREIALEKPEETIFLIPLRLDECEVPRGLRFYQWVDYFGEKKEESYDALTESLKLRYEQKLRLEEAERAQKEKLEAERIAREEAAREKAKRDTQEKAWLEAEEQAKLKAEKERAEREAVEKAAREKAEKEATEKARLEAEDRARQKAAKEKAEREKKERESVEEPIPVDEKPEGKTSQIESKSTETQTVQRKPSMQVAFWSIGFIVVVFIIGWALNNGNKPQISIPTSTNALVPTKKLEVVMTPTTSVRSTPKITSTNTIAPTSTSLPTEITDAKGVSMVLVPAGEFIMGSSSRDGFLECSRYYPYCYEREFRDVEPAHKVDLDAFYIDKYEVTNAQYKACVEQGVCAPPKRIDAQHHSSYYDNIEFVLYPVVNVDWKQSQEYCEWRQSNLPTEAQWEKAARSNDNRTYSWGDDLSCQYANYADCEGDLSAIGSYENGKGPYGVYDIIGNVSEWVADWYSETYYSISPNENPLGPNGGEFKVIRGGSYSAYVSSLMAYSRTGVFPDRYYSYLGFRCAKDITP